MRRENIDESRTSQPGCLQLGGNALANFCECDAIKTSVLKSTVLQTRVVNAGRINARARTNGSEKQKDRIVCTFNLDHQRIDCRAHVLVLMRGGRRQCWINVHVQRQRVCLPVALVWTIDGGIVVVRGIGKLGSKRIDQGLVGDGASRHENASEQRRAQLHAGRVKRMHEYNLYNKFEWKYGEKDNATRECILM